MEREGGSREGWLARGVDRHHSALPEVRLVHTCAFKYVSGNILCACTNAPPWLEEGWDWAGYPVFLSLSLSLSVCVHESVRYNAVERRGGGGGGRDREIGRKREAQSGWREEERRGENCVPAVLLNEILIQPLFTE